MTHKQIYLCGGISHQTLGQSQDWREEVAALLDGIHEQPSGASVTLLTYSPLRGETFFRDIKPDEKFSPTLKDNASLISTPNGVLGRDLNDVANASLVLANFLPSPDKVSIGSVFEIGYARAKGIPVVMVIQESGNIHDHIFLTNSANYIVRSLEDAVAVSKFLLLPQMAPAPKLKAGGLDHHGRVILSEPDERGRYQARPF